MQSTEISEVSPAEWISLNQFIHKVNKNQHPCISLYYQKGREQQTIDLLQETKRKEPFEKIEAEIERSILTPKNISESVGKTIKTICMFGWIEGKKITVKTIASSKKLPYIYMESKKPYLKPFQDILKTNYIVLLVTIDQKTVKIQKFQGSQVVQETKMRIDLQGRHKKGGQSQGRFLRARQTKIHVFFKKVAKKVKHMDSDSEFILVGGPGIAKTEFYNELDSDLVKKCRFLDDLTFSTSEKDVNKKIISHLYQHRKKHMTEIMSKYEKLVKEGLTAKRNENINKALGIGAVDTLIVSARYHTDSQFKKIIKMLELAQKTAATIEFVSSQKIIKKLEMHHSVLAILRFRIK